MSGRIGDLKTAGSGCVDPLGVPSAFAIVTVGRVVIFAMLLINNLQSWSRQTDSGA